MGGGAAVQRACCCTATSEFQCNTHVVGGGAAVQQPCAGGGAVQRPWCCAPSAELQCNTVVSDVAPVQRGVVFCASGGAAMQHADVAMECRRGPPVLLRSFARPPVLYWSITDVAMDRHRGRRCCYGALSGVAGVAMERLRVRRCCYGAPSVCCIAASPGNRCCIEASLGPRCVAYGL